MAVRIKLIHSTAPPPVLRAQATVSLANGVWLAGIQVVEAETGLRVVFPCTLVTDPVGAPAIAPALEFEEVATARKWEQRILQAFNEARGDVAPPPEKPAWARPPPPAPTGPVAEVHVGGAARGEPGPAAGAAVIALPGRPAIELARFVGAKSNSGLALFTGVLIAVTELERLKATGLALPSIVLKSDSSLIVKQFEGVWKIKEPTLAALVRDCRAVIERARLSIKFEQVPRSQNAAADALVERCLDAARGEG